MDIDRPEKCRIWSTDSVLVEANHGYLVIDSSRAGGVYKITNNAILKIRGIGQEAKVKITHWLVEERRGGLSCPTLDENAVENALTQVIPSVSKRRDALLLWLEKVTGSIGRKHYIGSDGGRGGTVGARDSQLDNLAMAETSSIDSLELRELVEFGIEAGFIVADPRLPRNPQNISLSFGGHQRVEELRTRQVSSVQGFVAMWFGGDMQKVFDAGFKPGIEDAGYSAFKINDKSHNNKIDDEIVAEIRRSRFVVADFTSDIRQIENERGDLYEEAVARGGVYFEAGFAKGLGRDVIWTARKDFLAKNLVHFDTRQFNHIAWETPEDLRDQLAKRISATLGDGPLKRKS